MRTSPLPVAVAVLLYAAAIVVWTLPNPPVAVLTGERPATGADRLYLEVARIRTTPWLATPLEATGGVQYWDLFAPDPATSDVTVVADIVSPTGVRRRSLGTVAERGLFGKMLAERVRKTAERLSGDLGEASLRTVCRRLAEPGATEVRLVVRVRPIAPPDTTLDERPSESIVYRYAVKP